MGLDMYLIKRKRDAKKITTNELWGFKDELIYWRKANMVHKFFCDNAEKIEEQISYKVSKINLQELLQKCKTIIYNSKLEEGKIVIGYTYENGVKKDILKDGKYIVNKDEIAEILPTQSGFFFGSTEYDEYYLEDIKYTQEKLEEIIDTIDYDNEDIYYLASW